MPSCMTKINVNSDALKKLILNKQSKMFYPLFRIDRN